MLPASGPTGVGEYTRCRTLAGSVRERMQDVRIKLVIDRHAPYVDKVPFETHLVQGSVTFNTAEVNRLMRAERPDLVLFDNAGRVAQLKCALEIGARTVFIAARAKKIRKAMSFRWVSRLDQVWVVQSEITAGPPNLLLRMRQRWLDAADVLMLQAIFPVSSTERRESIKRELGLADRPYVLFMPGGGGYSKNGRSSAELFAEAAGRFAVGSDLAVIMVMGPLYQGKLPEISGVTVRSSVNDKQAIDLLHDARFAVIGGGDLVMQALALKKVVVAVPTGAKDQPKRVRKLSGRSLVDSADLDVDAITAAANALDQNTDHFETLRQEVELCGISNGLDRAVDAVELLLKRS